MNAWRSLSALKYRGPTAGSRQRSSYACSVRACAPDESVQVVVRVASSMSQVRYQCPRPRAVTSLTDFTCASMPDRPPSPTASAASADGCPIDAVRPALGGEPSIPVSGCTLSEPTRAGNFSCRLTRARMWFRVLTSSDHSCLGHSGRPDVGSGSPTGALAQGLPVLVRLREAQRRGWPGMWCQSSDAAQAIGAKVGLGVRMAGSLPGRFKVFDFDSAGLCEVKFDGGVTSDGLHIRR
jgi:hypothetical protein